MHKLKDMQKEYERKGFHLQRLYKRRKADINGVMRSTFGSIMDPPQTPVFIDSVAAKNAIEKLNEEVKGLQQFVGNQANTNPTDDEEVIISGGKAL